MTDAAVSGGYDELAECGAAAGAITAHRTSCILRPASSPSPLSALAQLRHFSPHKTTQIPQIYYKSYSSVVLTLLLISSS